MLKFFRETRQNMLSKNKLSGYLIYAIGEILLIAVGIFMALQLQNWNETRKTAEVTQQTLERIKKEVVANQKQIDNVYDYHIMVRDTLNKIEAPKTEEEAGKSLGFWRGLRIFRLSDAAFQTAIQSGVSKDINANLMENLNSLYTSQEEYNDLSKTASQSLYSKDFTDFKNFKNIAVFLNMTMVDLYYFESGLKKQFTTCLQKIDSINTK